MNEICRSFEQPVEASTITRGDKQTRKIRGVASVYYNGQQGTSYPMGNNIVERIAPGAFDQLLEDDAIACVDHEKKLIVGRNMQNVKLWSSQRGMEYEIDLPQTTAANDLWENVQRGIIKGSSFKADVNYSSKDCVEWSREGNVSVCTIKRFSKLKDVSCVSDPAYKAADCQAVMRSLEQHLQEQETLKRLQKVKEINDKMNN